MLKEPQQDGQPKQRKHSKKHGKHRKSAEELEEVWANRQKICEDITNTFDKKTTQYMT